MSLLHFVRKVHGNFSIKIFFYFFFSMLVIAVASSVVFYQFQKKWLLEHAVENGTLMCDMLSDSVKGGVFAENEALLTDPLEGILKQHGVMEAAVFNERLAVLTCMRKDPATHAVHQDQNCKTVSAAVLRKLNKTLAPVALKGERQFDFYAPVTLQRAVFSDEGLFFTANNKPRSEELIVGYIHLVMDANPVKKATEYLLLRVVLMAGSFLVIGGGLTYFIVSTVTRPLQGLMDNIRARGVKVDGQQDDDEFSILNDAFLKLVNRLGEAFDTINQMNEELEKKVADRTGELAAANRELESHSRSLEKALQQLKEAQSQLVHSEKMVALGHLVAGVAHEINNTTNFVSGALPPLQRIVDNLKDLIGRYDSALAACEDQGADNTGCRDRLAGVERFKDEIRYQEMADTLGVLVRNIQEGASRTTKIVRDLQNFSRPDEERTERVDIHEYIDSTINLLFHDCKKKIDIVREYDPGLRRIQCYPALLNQVFTNILLNAIYAIDKEGTIRIRTWMGNDSVHIAFQDTGAGIPEKIQDKIFDPFFTTKDVGDGTGLGLSITYGIMKKHNGEVKVRSTVGKGTEFELVLPAQ